MAIDFDAIDANRDGHIVRSEALAHAERMRAQHRIARERRSGASFAAADLNSDGRLSRVEVDEKMPRLAKRFAWMDDNRDGFLDRTELQAGARR
jgi:Ca2+-binding EF-hand superfamily protein